ncbi:hypothetical protein NLJ89_g6770 [Agrocybe chaxingu]|uniref:Uncharacterized protein n=1 Tax=Agrocybe chaxingu TaxID=84603 RepID=A0A9W8K5S4_9AGAR|nr:hypothetical protein NLJ89_g6770 [Agrocybe chaxingu]
MDQFDLLQYIIPQDKSMDIKEESPGLSFSLLSPPITPSPPTLPCLPSTSRRRGSSSSLAGSKRPRPYPLVNRDSTSRKDELGTMSNIAYGNSWGGSATRNGHGRSHPPERRSSDGEDQSTYALSHQFINEPYLSNIEGGSDLRSISSSSSLTGAMGEASMHTRLSRSPASSHSGHLYTGNVQNPQNHDLTWNTNPMHANMTIAMNTSAYPRCGGTPLHWHARPPFAE